MATMHQKGSPLTSGRTVLWRTIPVLFISPLLSTFVNGHDLAIYPPVMYGFLALALYQYRRLGREWSAWTSKVPILTEKDVVDWYSSKLPSESSDDQSEKTKDISKIAKEAFRVAVKSARRGGSGSTTNGSDPTVSRVARGMPYADWILKKECVDMDVPEDFSTQWFTLLTDGLKRQKQLVRGLKEHNVLMLFRFARYDVSRHRSR
jgi:hypothetical protein